MKCSSKTFEVSSPRCPLMSAMKYKDFDDKAKLKTST